MVTSNQIAPIIVRVVPMVIIYYYLLKMKVLWLLGLFTTTYAYISTCTDLPWESEAKREILTLHNSGNVRGWAKFLARQCLTS